MPPLFPPGVLACSFGYQNHNSQICSSGLDFAFCRKVRVYIWSKSQLVWLEDAHFPDRWSVRMAITWKITGIRRALSVDVSLIREQTSSQTLFDPRFVRLSSLTWIGGVCWFDLKDLGQWIVRIIEGTCCELASNTTDLFVHNLCLSLKAWRLTQRQGRVREFVQKQKNSKTNCANFVGIDSCFFLFHFYLTKPITIKWENFRKILQTRQPWWVNPCGEKCCLQR